MKGFSCKNGKLSFYLISYSSILNEMITNKSLNFGLVDISFWRQSATNWQKSTENPVISGNSTGGSSFLIFSISSNGVLYLYGYRPTASSTRVMPELNWVY
jgi:hypothetical protein